MTDLALLNKCLGLFASAAGKPRVWVDEQRIAWRKVLEHVSDDDVRVACAAWLDAHPTEVPRAGDILALVKARARTALSRSTGCAGCKGTGWREVALHLTDGSVRTAAAGCSCAFGRSRPGPCFEDYAATHAHAAGVERVVIVRDWRDTLPPSAPVQPRWAGTPLFTSPAALAAALAGKGDAHSAERSRYLEADRARDAHEETPW